MTEKVSDAFDGKLLESLAQFELSIRTLTSSGIRGEKRSRRKGTSQEYADHRAYVNGDDLRQLDWNAFARLDAMLIRLYAAEETLPLEVIIDTSASMDFGTPTKFTTAARVGCCLSQVALLHSTPVVWRIAAEKALEPVKLSGRADLPRAFKVLDEVIPEGTGNLAEAIRRCTMKGPRKRSVVVLTAGYDIESIQPALKACRASGSQVYVITVLSPEELKPSSRGEFTYIDAETGVESTIALDRVSIKKYHEMLDKYRASWAEFSRKTGVAMIELSSDAELGPELFRTLATGGIIG
ncbi:MAG: DUF58 domain-containing protein [Planctomycetes bacterium]|nr:DUF58 domain-containing protein [Planctomycetota bacterium]